MHRGCNGRHIDYTAGRRLYKPFDGSARGARERCGAVHSSYACVEQTFLFTLDIGREVRELLNDPPTLVV